MKALVRNEKETVTEDMEIPGIDWDTGMPLTGAKWFGGPYTLIENYVPEVEENLNFIRELHEQLTEEEIPRDEDVVEDDDYVVIGGVRYSKEELRRLIE